MLAIALALTPGFYDFIMSDIEGKEVSFQKFRGKVVMVVNVASQCGLTPQYEALQKMFEKYQEKGFVVLGFPANEFREQEPGTNAEIAAFCKTNYKVTFPLFSKIVVKGDGIHPLYSWLRETGPRKDDIEWNFAKFLVGRDGAVKARFLPKQKPDDEAVVKVIETELAG